MPGAPVQHQRLQGLDPEGMDGGRVRLVAELGGGWSHHDHGRHVERHQGLGVGVVPEQHLAAQATRGLGHFGTGVPDQVHVGVGPLERQGLLAVPRVDVGDGKPAER